MSPWTQKMFIGCSLLPLCCSRVTWIFLWCESSMHPGSALLSPCQGISNIWLFLALSQKKRCAGQGEPAKVHFLASKSTCLNVERGMMIPASLPVRVHPWHESCCPFLLWQIHNECSMLHYAAGTSWGSGPLNYEMELVLWRAESTGLWNLSPPAFPRGSALACLYLADLFVQEGRATAQQTISFLMVAGLMTWNCSKCCQNL